MLTKPFLEAQPVLETLERVGHQAFFVGGCVRDLLLGREIHDIDIATSAEPAEVQDIFEKVIPVGIEHGTVIVRHDHRSYEVTTFRKDGTYTDSRHPDQVEFIRSIEEDLQRRDFTINALAMDKAGAMTDLFDGQKDLADRLIRTVGNSHERFKEDALRILRALRFASQLGFDIEAGTLSAMEDLKQEIRQLAAERITNEFGKLVSGRFFEKGLGYMLQLRLVENLPVFSRKTGILDKLPSAIQPLTGIAAFFAMLHILEREISVNEWISGWKCSNKEKQEAASLVKAFDRYQETGLDPWLAYCLPEENDRAFIGLLNNLVPDKALSEIELKAQRAALPIRSKKELALKGQDIMALYPERKTGPWIHELILNIEKAVVMGKCDNTKIDLKEWIKWDPPETN